MLTSAAPGGGQACADLNMSWSYAMATVHPWPPPMMQPRLKLTTAAKLAGYQAAMDGAFRDKEALLAGGTALPRGTPKEEPRPGGNKPRAGEEVSKPAVGVGLAPGQVSSVPALVGEVEEKSRFAGSFRGVHTRPPPGALPLQKAKTPEPHPEPQPKPPPRQRPRSRGGVRARGLSCRGWM